MARTLLRPVALSSVLVLSIPNAAKPRLTVATARDQDPRQKSAASKKKNPDRTKKQKELGGKDARLAFIRQAQVWAPTNVAEMDLRAGPQGPDAFEPNQTVTCDYVPTKLPGTTQKFDCAIGKDDVVKVRYGKDNGKVEGAVLGSRLLWALGFGADRVYPVQQAQGPRNEQRTQGGWAWPELDLIDETRAARPGRSAMP